jgi:exosortase
MHERIPLLTYGCPSPISVKIRNGLALVLLLISILAFFEPLFGLYRLTQGQSHYSHLLLVPLVSLYVFYLDRKVILASAQWSPLSGLLLVGLGASGYWEAGRATTGVDYLSLATLSLVLVIWGIFFFCYGLGTRRSFAFGLLFLVCMVPFPAGMLHAIIVFLQRSAAEVTDMIFSLLGVPVIRDDIVFGLSHITIRIDEGCSAVRSTLSLIITSIVAGHFSLRSSWAKLCVVVVMLPVAIIDNALRIVGLSLLANHVDKSFLTDGRLHDGGGYVVFALSITILLVLISLLRKLEQRPRFYSAVCADVGSDIAVAKETRFFRRFRLAFLRRFLTSARMIGGVGFCLGLAIRLALSYAFVSV